jgi:hypothetical protein
MDGMTYIHPLSIADDGIVRRDPLCIYSTASVWAIATGLFECARSCGGRDTALSAKCSCPCAAKVIA